MPNSNFPVITYPYGGTGLQVLGTNGQVLGTDGTQILWTTPSGGGSGTVTNIATGAGLTGGPITTTGTISAIQTNLTDAGTDGIVITNGTNAVFGASPVTIAQHVADTTHNGYLSSTDWNTFNNKQSSLTLGNLTDAGTDGIVVTGGTGAVIGSGTSLAQHVADTTHNGYLSSTDWNTFNGKGTGSVTSIDMTVPTFLSVSGNPITTSGTLAITLSGTALPLLNGGTGQTTKAAAFDALSPMSAGGDLIYGGASGTGTRLANGNAGQVLTSAGTTLAPTWATPTTGTVTSVAMTVPSILAVGGTPITTSGTLALTLANQNGNLVFCGPPSGSALAPTFRTLRTRDLPWPAPIYQSGGGTYTLPTLASSIFTNPTIVNTANLTVVLPTPSGTFAGFQYLFMTQDAHSITASTSVVVPLGSTTAGTAILPATAGKWCIICCDSTNWVIVAGN